MKKSLLAVAVASALPAVAYAQTNVTLYGIVDARVEYRNDAANTPANQATANKSGFAVENNPGSGSRFGLRGSEDLGGGLKAIFQIEHRFTPDTGDTIGGAPTAPVAAPNMKFWNGQSWVGLEGGFGAIRLGRQYTPTFWANIGSDVTGYNHYNNVAGAGGLPTRFDNSIEYRTPVWGGLQAYLMYAPDENFAQGAAGKNDAYGASVVWNRGGINVGAGYVRLTNNNVDRDGWTVSGAYNFGAFKLGAGYAQLDGATPAGDRDDWWVSAGAKIGPGDLWINYRRVDLAAPGGAGDINLLGVTYNYPLSRRTSVYASFRNDDPRQNIAGIQGEDKRAFGIGVRHLF